MAKEYIDREALIEFANNHVAGIDSNDIARFPKADVAEVVRCENCTHEANMIGNSYKYCFLHDMKVYADDFCSYGERRDDDD